MARTAMNKKTADDEENGLGQRREAARSSGRKRGSSGRLRGVRDAAVLEGGNKLKLNDGARGGPKRGQRKP